jgi:hypothetical protein
MNAFETSKCPINERLEHFSKYVRRQKLARFLTHYELFKKVLNVKGCVVECGVHHGGGVMTWAKLSSILEPYNYQRKIIGFDTFKGFLGFHENDQAPNPRQKVGSFKEGYDIQSELKNCIAEYDDNRFLNHINKIELVEGDATITIPKFIENQRHLIVALLYLDFDLYEPTVAAIRHFKSRIPKGGIIAFDEVNNANWPGETMAMLDEFELNKNALQCMTFEPNISFIQL